MLETVICIAIIAWLFLLLLNTLVDISIDLVKIVETIRYLIGVIIK